MLLRDYWKVMYLQFCEQILGQSWYLGFEPYVKLVCLKSSEG